MQVAIEKPALPEDGALAVGVWEDRTLTPSAASVDEAGGGALTRAMESARFTGKKNQTLTLFAPAGGTWSRVVLVGLGKADDLDTLACQEIGGTVAGQLLKSGETKAALMADPADEGGPDAATMAANMAHGARLGTYRFDRYRTRDKDEDTPSLETFAVHTRDVDAARQALAGLDSVAEGVFLARDLQNEPANVLSPEALADRARDLKDLGIGVTILDEAEMAELGMEALLAVGRGSERESRLIVLEYRGAGSDVPPIAFVGKGVCFDSGGISIKPSANMGDMKWDMGGAAVVLGTMRALAGRGAKVNAVAVIGAVENMPSGAAQRPGDIVTAMSGQTIEVTNTDAEGRMVMADCITWVQKHHDPALIVDVATLTGAIIIALGPEHAGLFSNDDATAEALAAAGRAAGDPVWRLPMGSGYDEMIKADFADMKNAGEREAGSIQAAQFLQRFLDEGRSWAHVDIAGTTWAKKDKPTVPKGATGFGVRLLDRWVHDAREQG